MKEDIPMLEDKWEDEKFKKWWFAEVGKKDKSYLRDPLSNITMDSLPGYYYSSLMEFAAACFLAGKSADCTLTEVRTDSDRLDQLRDVLMQAPDTISDALGLRSGWTDLREALDDK